MLDFFLIRHLRLSLFVGLLTTTLGGCAVVDEYGPRAITYNQQATSFKNSIILLNVMRAAFREPLQFTDVSGASGTATVSAGISGTAPFRIGGTQFTTPQLLNFTPTASMGGGPTFSTVNLNTQEFYQGFQTQISSQMIANYIGSGVNLRVLLPLIVSDIEANDLKNSKKIFIHNSGNNYEYQTFITAINQLINGGLSIEEEKKPDDPISLGMKKVDANKAELVGRLLQANAALTTGSFKVSKVENKKEEYQVVKASAKSSRFCFIDKTTPYKYGPGYRTAPLFPTADRMYVPLAFADGPVFTLTVRKNNFCGVERKKGETPLASETKQKVTDGLKFRMRSAQEIILFLGEMARTQLGLSGNEPVKLEYPNGNPFYLFKIEQRTPVGDEISAVYKGLPYTITTDPTGRDASSLVFQLTSDLIALNVTAKSYPTQNYITVAQ